MRKGVLFGFFLVILLVGSGFVGYYKGVQDEKGFTSWWDLTSWCLQQAELANQSVELTHENNKLAMENEELRKHLYATWIQLSKYRLLIAKGALDGDTLIMLLMEEQIFKDYNVTLNITYEQFNEFIDRNILRNNESDYMWLVSGWKGWNVTNDPVAFAYPELVEEMTMG